MKPKKWRTILNLIIYYVLALSIGNYLFGVVKKMFITQAAVIQMSPNGYIAYNWPLMILDILWAIYIIGAGVLFGWIYYKKENYNEEK